MEYNFIWVELWLENEVIYDCVVVFTLRPIVCYALISREFSYSACRSAKLSTNAEVETIQGPNMD
jgi:hypothetical protein